MLGTGLTRGFGMSSKDGREKRGRARGGRGERVGERTGGARTSARKMRAADVSSRCEVGVGVGVKGSENKRVKGPRPVGRIEVDWKERLDSRVRVGWGSVGKWVSE